MDTSVLAKLFMIAPDLMEEVELRTLVLERVAALGPNGSRALAQRLHLAERFSVMEEGLGEISAMCEQLRKFGSRHVYSQQIISLTDQIDEIAKKLAEEQ